MGGVNSGGVGSKILYTGRVSSGRSSPLHGGESTKMDYIEEVLPPHSLICNGKPCFWVTASVDSSVPTKGLSYDHLKYIFKFAIALKLKFYNQIIIIEVIYSAGVSTTE